MMRRLLILVVTVVVASAAAAETNERRRLSAEVLWELARPGDPVVSPDGSLVVVPVTGFDAETNESETRLWLLQTGDGASPSPLTVAGFKASEPVFSPDGSQLAFISKRDDDEAGQIYLLPMAAPGEATRLTSVPTGVSGLRWAGEHLYFISEVWPGLGWEEMAERLKTEEEDHITALTWSSMPFSYFDHYLDESREHQLYRIPAKGGEVEAITGPTGLTLMRGSVDASHYDVSPAGDRVAFVADTNAGGVYPNPDVFLLTPGKASAVNLTTDNRASDHGPRFSPDGKHLAFVRQRIAGFYGDQGKLMLYGLREGRARMLHEAWDRGVDGMVWAPDSKGMYAAIGDRAVRRIYYLPAGGGEPRAVTRETDFGGLSVAADGTLVAANQSAVNPVRIGIVDTGTGVFTRLDHFNDEVLANVDVGTYESVTYKGHGGAEIQMWVHYPPGFDRSKSYPLMMLIHGGPHGAVTENFHYRWNAQTFASWGYVTAWPNFHGSSGFGQDFVDAINPDWITRPYADVIAAAEYLAGQEYIDAERMVAAGGSYGGYLSSIILGREHPFKALVIHAAVYDLYAQMSADFAVNMQRFGPYWENPSSV